MSGEGIWSIDVSNLNDGVASFVMNVVQYVLPHKFNLMRWNKMDDRQCIKYCCLSKQNKTLWIGLNKSTCDFALKSGRYLWQHNSILATMYNYQCHNASGWDISVDLFLMV